MPELTPSTKNRILDTIQRDLKPSSAKVYTKTGLAVLVGGFLSLLVCGQFGFGMTALAHHTHTQLQDSFGSFICAAVCGFLFAAFPVMVLRLLCRAIEFRAILKVSRRAPLVWIFLAGGFLAYHGEHGWQMFEVSLWLVAAIGSFHLLADLIDRASARSFRIAS